MKALRRQIASTAALRLAALAFLVGNGISMPVRQRRDPPLNNLDFDLSQLLRHAGGTLMDRAQYVKVWLSREYNQYLWYVCVFPDSRNDPSDNLTVPGEELGLAKAWALHHCGTVARSTSERQNEPTLITAVMYQHAGFEWRAEDAQRIEEYRILCVSFLRQCAEENSIPPQPLDLTDVAKCMITRGSLQSRFYAAHGLRAVLVIRCEPYAMLLDPGVMKPGCDFPLRGPDSRPKDMLEAYVIPPLPPWW